MIDNCHKVGDSFTRLFPIPASFGDGYFTGWEVASEIRGEQGELIATVACEWLDVITTRNLKLRVIDTTGWKPGVAFIDIQFRRISDGEVMSTTTAEMQIVPDVTA